MCLNGRCEGCTTLCSGFGNTSVDVWRAGFFVESSWQKVKLGWSGILIGNREGRDPPRQLRWYFLGERGVCRLPPSGLGLNFLEPSALKTNSIVWNLIFHPYTVNPSRWVCLTVTFSLSPSPFLAVDRSAGWSQDYCQAERREGEAHCDRTGPETSKGGEGKGYFLFLKIKIKLKLCTERKLSHGSKGKWKKQQIVLNFISECLKRCLIFCAFPDWCLLLCWMLSTDTERSENCVRRGHYSHSGS